MNSDALNTPLDYLGGHAPSVVFPAAHGAGGFSLQHKAHCIRLDDFLGLLDEERTHLALSPCAVLA